jgi:hypothetical protein
MRACCRLLTAADCCCRLLLLLLPQVVREDALGKNAHLTGDNAFSGIIVDLLDKRGQLPFRLTQVCGRPV